CTDGAGSGFFFSSRRRHTSFSRDWSSDVCSSDLRTAGARRIVIAPWFLAHGRITDRILDFAGAQGITVSEPLGSHNLVAATVLRSEERRAGREWGAAWARRWVTRPAATSTPTLAY